MFCSLIHINVDIIAWIVAAVVACIDFIALSFGSLTKALYMVSSLVLVLEGIFERINECCYSNVTLLEVKKRIYPDISVIRYFITRSI